MKHIKLFEEVETEEWWDRFGEDSPPKKLKTKKELITECVHDLEENYEEHKTFLIDLAKNEFNRWTTKKLIDFLDADEENYEKESDDDFDDFFDFN